jgi:hypothetical protein
METLFTVIIVVIVFGMGYLTATAVHRSLFNRSKELLHKSSSLLQEVERREQRSLTLLNEAQAAYSAAKIAEEKSRSNILPFGAH